MNINNIVTIKMINDCYVQNLKKNNYTYKKNNLEKIINKLNKNKLNVIKNEIYGKKISVMDKYVTTHYNINDNATHNYILKKKINIETNKKDASTQTILNYIMYPHIDINIIKYYSNENYLRIIKNSKNDLCMFVGLSIAYARHSIDYGMMFEKDFIEYYLNKFHFNSIFELILIIYNLYPNEVFNYANRYNNFSYKNKYIIYENPKNYIKNLHKSSPSYKILSTQF